MLTLPIENASTAGASLREVMQGVPLRAVLTRPAQRQVELEVQLRKRGWQVLAMPALELVAIDSLPSSMFSLAKLKTYDWVMFVSRSAWQIYYARMEQAWPSDCGIAVVGQGTAAAVYKDLQKQSDLPTVLSPDLHATQDSEGLWKELSSRLTTESRVLIVAGRDGRSWLTEQLRQRGVATDVLYVYERRPAALSEKAQDCLKEWSALSLPGQSGVWLLTSTHSIETLTLALEKACLLNAVRPAAWLVTHPRLLEPVSRLAEKIASDVAIPVIQCAPDPESIQNAFDALIDASL